ncbi:GyrI-like domain-containing protein [Clostridium botulinum]|uniref:GyrI-like domain-containing protein n=1 Tax=Clostridium botulinum TaxID=1491 RepID=UPI0031194040
MEEGLSVKVLHIGDYDYEPKSSEKIIKFMSENNLQKIGETRREIYLSDARKVANFIFEICYFSLLIYIT